MKKINKGTIALLSFAMVASVGAVTKLNTNEVNASIKGTNTSVQEFFNNLNVAQNRGLDDTIFINGFEPAPVLSLIAGTSFEEEVIMDGVNSERYTDTGDASVAHDLVNNAGETPIDLSGGQELGVNARYEPYDVPAVGLTDGDFVGVSNFVDNVGAFTNGNQGYQFSDADGNMIVEFDVVDMTGSTNNVITMDYFVQSTGWEGNGLTNDFDNDRIRIYVKDLTNAAEIDIFNSHGFDINSLGVEGMWVNSSTDLPNNISMQIVVEFRSGATAEALYLDNIRIMGEIN